MSAPFAVRAARAGDAAELARLANLLNVHEGKEPDRHSAASILRDGFGADPAFGALVAEADGRLVGYAMHFRCYNTDLAARGLWLADLFVEEDHCGRGIGRALLAATARAARDAGLVSVWWTVRTANARARAFYAALGARDEDDRVLQLDGDALARLAGEAG